MTTTPLGYVQYYESQLIYQYVNKPKASGMIGAIASQMIIPQTTVQSLVFSLIATSGTFVLSYNGVSSASINWNDSAATIQGKLQAISGLGSVTVLGSIAAKLLLVTFTGVIPPALSLIQVSNSLVATATPITITIAEIDETIPLAIQDAFNLISGSVIATGVQLDVLGKYAGVSRTGLGFTGQITLDDADFLHLIRMAISKNSAGSSLSVIQDFLALYFLNQIFVFDYQNMTMTYVISAANVSANLVQLFITEGLLPKPMAVRANVFYAPNAHLFSFRTYIAPSPTGSPFNTYSSYQSNTPWLTYSMEVV